MKLYLKIILLIITCLMITTCGKSVEDKLIGKWEATIHGELTVWTFSEDFTLTMTGGPPQSLKWELFEELSGDNPSLMLIVSEMRDRGPEVEMLTTIEFVENNKLLLNDIGSPNHPSGPSGKTAILTKLGK